MNWRKIASSAFSVGKLRQDESILRYAVAYWPDHVRLHAEGRIDDRLVLIVKDLLRSPNEGSAAYAYWRLAFINYYRSRALTPVIL